MSLFFRHLPLQAAKLCYQDIHGVPGGQLGNGGLHCFSEQANPHSCQIAVFRLPTFSLVSHVFLGFLLNPWAAVTISTISVPSVFFLLLSYKALAHVPSHALATAFIIKLSQDHTTVLHQMRFEVTGWRLQHAITETRNVSKHLLIKSIQCHVKTKGQKQEWIMILLWI